MPASTALILLPCSAALLFAIGALAVKRASHLGAGVWHTVFVTNMISAVSYSLMWPLADQPVQVALLWQPALIAACLFTGMLCQFIAMDRGDVSVAVPVMGLKLILVAALTPLLLAESLSPMLAVSAVLSVIGVGCLNYRGAHGPTRGVRPAILYGGCAAASFALFDVLVAKWGPVWGAGRLLPCVFWMNAVLSLGCIAGFSKPLSSLPRATWQWLILGTSLISLQSILFVGCLAVYGKATAANVIYSARGLLSVVLVVTVGHWFSSVERHHAPRVLGLRLLGAALMLAAIILAVMTK
jgi:drug/metabolite transporter (DMT)-like permease